MLQCVIAAQIIVSEFCLKSNTIVPLFLSDAALTAKFFISFAYGIFHKELSSRDVSNIYLVFLPLLYFATFLNQNTCIKPLIKLDIPSLESCAPTVLCV